MTDDAKHRRSSDASEGSDLAQWSYDDAVGHPRELIDSARERGPQVIRRDGRTVAVVVGAEEWERLRRPEDSLAAFLLSSPLRGAGLDLERIRDAPRELEP